ncbi:hypothetical protein JCM10212_002632 [Sporobolomyces blumeae]
MSLPLVGTAALYWTLERCHSPRSESSPRSRSPPRRPSSIHRSTAHRTAYTPRLTQSTAAPPHLTSSDPPLPLARGPSSSSLEDSSSRPPIPERDATSQARVCSSHQSATAAPPGPVEPSSDSPPRSTVPPARPRNPSLASSITSSVTTSTASSPPRTEPPPPRRGPVPQHSPSQARRVPSSPYSSKTRRSSVSSSRTNFSSSTTTTAGGSSSGFLWPGGGGGGGGGGGSRPLPPVLSSNEQGLGIEKELDDYFRQRGEGRPGGVGDPNGRPARSGSTTDRTRDGQGTGSEQTQSRQGGESQAGARLRRTRSALLERQGRGAEQPTSSGSAPRRGGGGGGGGGGGESTIGLGRPPTRGPGQGDSSLRPRSTTSSSTTNKEFRDKPSSPTSNKVLPSSAPSTAFKRSFSLPFLLSRGSKTKPTSDVSTPTD